jgi:enoyl-CoA hydratase
VSFANLIVEDEGAVRVITVNRPSVLNALNLDALVEIERALDEAARGGGVRAVVVTGAGEKAFVAGADIQELDKLGPDEARAYSATGHRVFDRIGALPMPVIAAVNGFALGGGLELALACDFIYASDNARMGLVEANLGVVPGFGGVARLSRRVGQAMAAELIFAAAQVKADEALRIGLVNRVLPQASLLAEAKKAGAAIAEKGPLAVAAAKRLLREGEGADVRVANSMEQTAFGLLFATADKAEGMSAFLAKRKASFRGA